MILRKGQAAMEYLMTYGWAILIVLAVMGILVYLVRPQQIESCTVAMPFQCEANQYTINSNQIITVNLRNLGSVAVNINGTKCPSDTGTMRTLSPPVQITPGSIGTIIINCSESKSAISSPKVGQDVFHETMLIRYFVADSNIVKYIPIEMVVRYS